MFLDSNFLETDQILVNIGFNLIDRPFSYQDLLIEKLLPEIRSGVLSLLIFSINLL